MLAVKGWDGGSRQCLFNGSRVSVQEDERVLEMDGVTVAQQCE